MSREWRVSLRPFRSEDISGMRAWVNDPDTTRFLGGAYALPETWETTDRRLSGILSGDAGGAHFVVADRESGKYLGQCDLMMMERTAQKAEVAMVLCPDAQNQGYGREALALLCDYAFRVLNLRRLYLYVAEDNVPAVRCYQAAGFEIEGRLKEHMFADGRYRDVLVMARMREEES